MKNPDGGKRLRLLIERAALPFSAMTQTELAAKFGVTKSAMLAWFTGQEPNLGSITAIAAFAGVPRWRVLATFDGDGPDVS